VRKFGRIFYIYRYHRLQFNTVLNIMKTSVLVS
jgi:hypothetical protein